MNATWGFGLGRLARNLRLYALHQADALRSLQYIHGGVLTDTSS